MPRDNDPREMAFALIDEFIIDPGDMATACLKYMSLDQIQDMLESNEYDQAYKETLQQDEEE